MYHLSKARKILAILSSIAVTLISTVLINFASTYTQESNNASSTVSTSSEQTVNSSSQSKVIKIDSPGDYRLVGIGVGISNSEDPNTIIVNTRDRITITSSGEYNIILDNVKVDIRNGDPNIKSSYGSEYDGIIESRNGTKINLILEGENILKTNFCRALWIQSTDLTISEESENSSLEISGLYEGIFAVGSNITINGGIIDVNSCRNIGITTDNVTINGGNLIVDRIQTGIQFEKNLIINGGAVTVTNTIQDENQGVNERTMYGDTTTVITNKQDGEKYYLGERRFGILSYHGDMIVNDGVISASGTQGDDYYTLDVGIDCNYIEFNGGYTQSNGIVVENKALILNSGAVETENILAKKIIIKSGELNGLKYINRRLFDVKNVKNGETKMNPIPPVWKSDDIDQCSPYFPFISYLNVTGGTINGVFFPTTGSAASTAFDKELSTDENAALEK